VEARKLNKVYQIDAREAQAWADDGYDIYDHGKLKLHAAGKSVPLADHEKALEENRKLKAEIAKLKKA
jgi:hypothetical protein